MAAKTHFLAIETGFNYLNADFCKIEIRKMNVTVLKYMKEFKITLVKEDDLNYYFILTKENFFIRRNKLFNFLNGGK